MFNINTNLHASIKIYHLKIHSVLAHFLLENKRHSYHERNNHTQKCENIFRESPYYLNYKIRKTGKIGC